MQKKVLKNAGWIIGCKVVKAVLTLVVTAITTRYLGVEKYGLLNYAAGLVAFFIPIMRLGLDAIMVHEIVQRPEEEGKIVGTVMTLSTISAFLCVLGVSAFTMVVNAGEKDTIIVSAIYSLMLFFQALEMLHYWFQAKLLAKFSAIAMLVSYIFVALFQALLIYLNADVYLFALSFSIDYFIIAIILLIIFKKKSDQKIRFSFKLAKSMLSISKYYIVSTLVQTIYMQTDKIMLKLMIGDAATGIYTGAITCASMTSFVFVAIIDSMRPEIFAGKNQSQEQFENRVTELYSVIIYFSLIQCVVITALAPIIIEIMCSAQFIESVPVLRVAVWFTTFSYLGTIRNVWMLAEGNQRYLWIINLTGALTNVALNFVFIPILGALGAAVASVITQVVANVIVGYIIKPIRANNRLMVRSLNPKYLKGLISSFRRG